jgi:hypothetical protein
MLIGRRYVKIGLMPRKLLVLILMFCCLACARPGIRQEPAAGTFFQAVTIKFNFQDSQGRQSGKIHWRFDADNAKFLIFNPLNQVALELDVAGEIALLLRPGKKLYWQGDFSLLLERLWGIQLNLGELKRLILDGVIPAGDTIGKDIKIDLQTGPESPSPRVIHIRQGDSDLTLKIVNSETRPGRVILLDHALNFRAAELVDVLSDD